MDHGAFSVFDLFFSVFTGLHSAVFLLVGLVFAALALGIVGQYFWSRQKGRIYEARIKGVRVKNKKAVVSDGESQVVASDSNDLDDLSREEYEAKGKAGSRSLGVGGTLFLLVFMIVPIVFVGFGGYQVYKYFDLTAHGVRVDARVIDNERKTDSEGSVSYYAVVRFVDAQGLQREVKDNISIGSKPSFQVGETVELYYDPSDPDRFIMGGFSHSATLGLIFMGFGSVFIGLFAFVLMRAKKPERQSLDKNTKTDFQNEMYYCVYEYRGADGSMVEAESTSGSNVLGRKIPGTPVRILIHPNQPQKVRLLGYGSIFGSMFLAGIAGLLIFIAMQTSRGPVSTTMGLILIAVFAGFKIRKALEKGKGFIKPKSQWGKVKDWQDKKYREFLEKRQNLPILTSEEFRQRMGHYNKLRKTWAPFVFILAFCAFGGAYYMGQDMLELTRSGQRADGEVIRVVSSRSSDSTTYHALVQFRAYNQQRYEFKDSVGSSSRLYDVGDRVSVLYDTSKPNDAIIDRGLLNWALSGGLALFGALLFLLGVRGYSVSSKWESLD